VIERGLSTELGGDRHRFSLAALSVISSPIENLLLFGDDGGDDPIAGANGLLLPR